MEPSPDPEVTNYVATVLRSPLHTLSHLSDRAAFLKHLFGDPHLVPDAAEDDQVFFLQLTSRATQLAQQACRFLHNYTPEEAEYVLSTFALLATFWPVLVDQLGTTPLVASIIQTTRRVGRSPTTASRALAVLRTLATTYDMRRRVVLEGGVDLALQLMSQFKPDTRVQHRGASLIANVSFGCEHRKRRIVQQGAVATLVAAMVSFPTDQNIQCAATLAIRNLTAGAQVNQYIAGNEGAIDAVASALLRFRASSRPGAGEVRLQCVLAIESLCREEERNRQRVIDIDDSITDAVSKQVFVTSESKEREMEPSQESELINEDGDVVVEEEEQLVYDHGTDFSHGTALCPGTSPLLVPPFPETNDTVAQRASAEKIDVGTNGESVPRSSELNATPVNPKHPDEKKLVLKALVHVMRRDPDDSLLLEACLSLLTRLAMGRGQVQVKLGCLGAIQVAIAAIRKHINAEGLVARGCSLIRCLCYQGLNRGLVTSGLPVLISVARKYSMTPGITREVVSALGNVIFEHQKNQAWVVKNGGVDVIVKIMNEYGASDLLVLDAGICTLRNCIYSSRDCALAARKAHALEAAFSALNQTTEALCTGQRIVQEQTTWFIVDMSHLVPEAISEMQSADIGDLIENCLAKLPLDQHPELHESGSKLIAALTIKTQQVADRDRKKHASSRSLRYDRFRASSSSLLSLRGDARRATLAYISAPRRLFRPKR